MCQSLAKAELNRPKTKTTGRRVVESRFIGDATGLGTRSCGDGQGLGADVNSAAFAYGIEKPDDVA